MQDFITIALAILGLSTIVIIHEFGHFICAKFYNIPIKTFSIGFGPGWSYTYSGIEYRLGIVPLGGYVSFLSHEEMEKRGMPKVMRTFPEFPFKQKILVFAAGPAVNIIFGILLLFFLMPSERTSLAPVISKVQTSSLAEASGIKPGDRIISVAGRSIDTRDDALAQIKSNLLDDNIEFVFKSEAIGVRYSLSAPSSLWREGNGLGILFISAEEAGQNPALVYYREFSFADKALMSVDYAKTIIVSIAKTLIQLPTNSYARDQLGSFIMLGAEGSKVAQRNWIEYLFFIASVNLMIAFVNLLPFPFTDGSQIVLTTIQRVLKRPLPKAVESMYFYLGVAAFASIFVLGITNDMARYIM
ncbi:M50 family metallopeptidase [Microbulbifer epialgicus]|uniref:RIP metalloprotease n=1 Tax=Microbulbifer epialgicus TaxID=393907 RepID=A0ABV4NV41_9GAMM